MSDSPQSPPIKPKPGSLRDRIAAFEKPNAAPAAPPTRPPVRPKPGAVAWKPAPPSPTSPASGGAKPEHEEQKRGGMSASDAKESIGRGGSLKERMAALQGKGAFGAGLPAGPPPVGPKPMKRPPLVVPPPPAEEDELKVEARDESKADDEAHHVQGGHSVQRVEDAGEAAPPKGDDDERVEEEQDEETKERERRAAIAARMARLGGARVGMAPPPIFGKKPEVKPKPKEIVERTKEEQETDKREDSSKAVESISPSREAEASDTAISHRDPASEDVVSTSDAKASLDSESGKSNNNDLPQANEDEQTVLKEPVVGGPHSSHETAPPESGPTPPDSSSLQPATAGSRSPPPSMPLPAVPRRAGPPRKKSARNLKSAQEAPTEARHASPEPSTESTVVSPPPAPVEQIEERIHTREEDLEHEPVVSSEHTLLEDQAVEETNVSPMDQSDRHPDDQLPVQATHDEVQDSPELPEGVPAEKADGEEESEAHTLSPVAAAEPSPPLEHQADDVDLSSTVEHEVIQPISVEPAVEADADTLQSHDPPSDLDSPPEDSILAETTSKDETNVEHSPVSPVARLSSEPVPEPETLEPVDNAVHSAEQSQTERTDIETEDDEIARRKRIAERMAKMGGRNPFAMNPVGTSAAAPPRKASVDEEPKTSSEHIGPLRRDSHPDDAFSEHGLVAEPVIPIESQETGVPEPRVSSEERGESANLHILKPHATEHEETKPEHKTFEYTAITSEDHSVVSVLQESPTLGEFEEMAPRITRAIPPIPSQTTSETREAPSTPVERERTSAQHSTPQQPPPPELKSVVPPDARRISVSRTLEGSITSEKDFAHSPEEKTSRLSSSEIETSSAFTEHISSRDSFPSRRSTLPSASYPVSPPLRAPPAPPAGPPPGPPPPRPLSPESDSISSPITSAKRPVPPPRRIPSNPEEDLLEIPVTRRSSQPPSEAGRSPSRGSPSISMGDSDIAPSPEADISQSVEFIVRDSVKEEEVLEDSEPDPIDPSFYSPPRSPAATPRSQASFSIQSKELASDDATEEDREQSRRRTIAERMAKLGGIKFGAPPPIPHKIQKIQEPSITEDPGEKERATEEVYEEPEEIESEEAERARRQTIAARLAEMGGMRIGMLPQPSAPIHPRVKSDEIGASEKFATHPSHQKEVSPVFESRTSDVDPESEDGVKVEAESELSMEEVTVDDAVEEALEVPPPVPSRSSRPSQGEIPPALPGGRRPPVPTVPPPNRPAIPSAGIERPSTVVKQADKVEIHSSVSHDFVVVEESAKEAAPPPMPPPRTGRQQRSLPPSDPPRPTQPPTKATSSSQWELPDIPTGSFDLKMGDDLGLGSSFTSEKKSTTSRAPTSPPRSAAPTRDSTISNEAQQIKTPEELMELSNSIGTAVHGVASSCYERSKKTVIGDGTSRGFVAAVLAQVPQASKMSYGHLVYSQTGNVVSRRSSNIMPGDVIQLTEAKLKGHKGLQSYNQTVGTAQEPAVAIISEFDAKKSKVKVFQANQHVNVGQTVETASYRLEDLKSGNIKIFRVARV